MKIVISLLLITFINLNSCNAQESESIEKIFLREFINEGENYDKYFYEGILYIAGNGFDYTDNGIQVIYLNIGELRKKLKNEGEFNFVSIEEVIIENNEIKTSFEFLTAVDKVGIDAEVLDNTNAFYCINICDDKKKIKAYWCGEKFN